MSKSYQQKENNHIRTEELDNLRTTININKDSLYQENEVLSEISFKIKIFKSDINDKNKEIKVLKNENKDLKETEYKYKLLNWKFDDLESKHEDLIGKYENVKLSNNDLINKIHEKQSEINNLKANLNNKENKVKELKLKYNDLIDKHSEDTKNNSLMIKTYEKSIESYKQDKRDLNEKITKISINLNNALDSLDISKSEGKLLKEEINELKNYKHKYIDTSSNLDIKSKEVQTLKLQVNCLTNSKNNLEEDFSVVKRSLKDENKKLIEKIAKKDLNIKDKQDKIQESYINNKILKTEVKKYEELLKDKQLKLDFFYREIGDLKNDINSISR